MDLSSIKSANVIEGEDKVRSFLMEHMNEDATGHTQLIVEDDAPVKLQKRTPADGNAFIDKRKKPGGSECRQLAEAIGLPWIEEYEGRVIPWYASDERVDRHGDIVEQSWKFDNFANNPVMLYSHSWELPPIGNVIKWVLENRNADKTTKGGPALVLWGLFATKEQYEFADTIFRLADANILRTGSVGFYPGKVVEVSDPKEREQLGLGRWGYIYQDNELVEWSPCSVPANAGAYQQMSAARKKGLLQAHDIQVLRELRRIELLSTKNADVVWKRDDTVIRNMWKHLFPEVSVSEHKDINVPLLLDELEKQGNPPAEPAPTVDSMLKSLADKLDNVTAVVEDIRNQVESGKDSASKGGDKEPDEVEVLAGMIRDGDIP